MGCEVRSCSKNKTFYVTFLAQMFGMSKNIYTFAIREPAKPLITMLKCAGRFYFMSLCQERLRLQKHTPHHKSLVQLLKERGMKIADDDRAEHCLCHIGYYRLSAYMYPLLSFPKCNHRFKPGASFDKVMMLYRFDKELRMLIFREIEKIEIAVRCAIVNVGTKMTNYPILDDRQSKFL